MRVDRPSCQRAILAIAAMLVMLLTGWACGASSGDRVDVAGDRSGVASSPPTLAASPLPSMPSQSVPSQSVLRVYHIGNSVTDTLNYRNFEQLVQRQGRQYIYGRHMIPGAPLAWIWEHPTDGFKEDPFGYYPNALPNYAWDVLTLQPFDRHLNGNDGDLAMAKNYINLAVRQSPTLRIYIYSRWMRKDKEGNLDFDRQWLRPYTGEWDGSEETRDYFERLTLELRQAYPALQQRIFLIPVGDVLHELNQRMAAGQVPGYRTIAQVYRDGIHFNDVGSYIVAATFYTTLYHDRPDKLAASVYGVTDRRLATSIHQAVWQVVSTHILAGAKQESR